jgi:GWxTD domain-containing protein
MERRVSSLALVLALVPALTVALDKDEKQWLEEVKSLILPAEEKIFNGLKTKEDRAEFQKIFWARRDPNLLTPENEYQKTFEERRAKAKELYTWKGMDRDAGVFLPLPGDQTDCGLVYVILGEPTSKEKKEGEKKQVGTPVLWTYKEVKGGEFMFDGNCQFPVHGADPTRESLKQARIVQGGVSYYVEKGKLTKPLADMLPKPGPGLALFLQPRTDFEMVSQASFVKVQDGSTGVFGLVKGDATPLTMADAGGVKNAKVIVRAEAKGADGANIVDEQEVMAEVDAENKFVASYRMPLRPGAYELKVGAVDPVSNKGSVLTQALDVPDMNKGELTIASIFALSDIQDVPADKGDKAAAKHAYHAFEMGTTRLVPRFGNVFKQSDNLQISYQFYDPKVDEATKKPATVARLSILKSSGGVAAEAPEQEFDTPVAGSAVGPVSLAKYLPGKYRIVLKVTDKVAQKEYKQEATFEVRK